MKERVLITGASGFIGYHLIEEALKNNIEVYVAVRKSSRIDHLGSFDINYTYPDFTNISALKQELEENKYDYIIHAAGVTRARSQKEYNHINAGYTHNLALAALERRNKFEKVCPYKQFGSSGAFKQFKWHYHRRYNATADHGLW